MRARVSKKVLRLMRANDRRGTGRYRFSTYVRAHRVWAGRVHWSFDGFTVGGRWGRWDPAMPHNPAELPF